jgi:hypothetical protein
MGFAGQFSYRAAPQPKGRDVEGRDAVVNEQFEVLERLLPFYDCRKPTVATDHFWPRADRLLPTQSPHPLQGVKYARRQQRMLASIRRLRSTPSVLNRPTWRRRQISGAAIALIQAKHSHRDERGFNRSDEERSAAR